MSIKRILPQLEYTFEKNEVAIPNKDIISKSNLISDPTDKLKYQSLAFLFSIIREKDSYLYSKKIGFWKIVERLKSQNKLEIIFPKQDSQENEISPLEFHKLLASECIENKLFELFIKRKIKK